MGEMRCSSLGFVAASSVPLDDGVRASVTMFLILSRGFEVVDMMVKGMNVT